MIYDQEFYDYADARAAHHMAMLEQTDDLSYEELRKRIDDESRLTDDGDDNEE